MIKIEIAELCKGVHCVDLGESFPTHIFLQNLASIQPRTSPFKFARSPRTDPPGLDWNSAGPPALAREPGDLLLPLPGPAPGVPRVTDGNAARSPLVLRKP